MATKAQIAAYFWTRTDSWQGWCQAAMYRVCLQLGIMNVVYPTATAAYNASVIVSTDPTQAQPGDFHYWAWSTDGHVALETGGGGSEMFMGSRHVDELCGVDVGFISFERFQAKAGLRYLGFSRTNGANDITIDLPAVKPNQRRAGADGVRFRPRPYVEGESLEWYAPNTIHGFDGWIHGQNVDGNDIWFRSIADGTWAWSGNLGGNNVHDLKDLNPKPVPDATERTVMSEGGPLNIRSNYTTTSPVVGTYAPSEKIKVTAFVSNGTAVNGISTWFRTDKGWVSATGVTNASTTGLADVTIVVPPPAPYVPRDPEIVDLEASDFPAWVTYNVAIDNDETGMTNEEAYFYYLNKGQDYKYYPVESHTHWWGDASEGATHDSIVAYLGRTKDLSVDFVTSPNRITRMGSLSRVSYTTGPRSMYGWSSENDPNLTEDGYKTLGLLHYLIEKKNPRLNQQRIRLHKEFMATSCSDIDVRKVRDYANMFLLGQIDFATGELIVTPPVEPPVVDPTDPTTPVNPGDETPGWFKKFLVAIVDAIKKFLGIE